MASTQVYGLCRGMAFAALGYYLADCPRPAEETSTDNIPPKLASYIPSRMRDSLLVGQDPLHPNNASRVLAWMVVENRRPRGKAGPLDRTREEGEKLNGLMAKNGAWPIMYALAAIGALQSGVF